MAFEAGAGERSGPGSLCGMRELPQVPPGRAGRSAGCVPGGFWISCRAQVCSWSTGFPWRWGTLLAQQGPGCRENPSHIPESRSGVPAAQRGGKHPQNAKEEVFETDLKNVSLFWITFNTVSPGGDSCCWQGREWIRVSSPARGAPGAARGTGKAQKIKIKAALHLDGERNNWLLTGCSLQGWVSKSQ